MDDEVWFEGSRLVNGFRAYQMMAAACRLRLPDLVAAGPRTFAELAAQTGMQPAAMKGLLKGLAAWRIFTGGADGSFSATPLSDLFRSDRRGLRNITENAHRASTASCSQRTGFA